MIERVVEVAPDQGDATLLQCLERMGVRMDMFSGRVGTTVLRDSARDIVGLANHAVINIFNDVKQSGVIRGRGFFGNSRVFSREEALVYAAICWTIKDGFKHSQPDPYENSWSQILDQTRTNLPEDSVLGSLLSDQVDPDAKFSTGNASYEAFTVGRLRRTKHGGRDSSNFEHALSAAEVFSKTQEWDRKRLEILHDSLNESVDAVQANRMPPEFIAERIVRIAELAVQRPSHREIGDVEEFFFKNDVKACMQLMELLGVNDLIELEAAVRRMAASGGRTENLRINTN